jgi:hypothetical protein
MIRKRYGMAAAAVAALALGGTAAAGAAPQNLDVVKGNNGTVKADVVGCTVSLDWYGMDASAVSFAEFRLQGSGDDTLLQWDVQGLDSDGAYGGDLDGSHTYDLGPAIAAQGLTEAHVKVTTHTTYSQGADTKYKVVWVSGCEAPPDDGGGNE